MRRLAPVVLVLTLLVPAAGAAAEPTGKVAVLRAGELDGFTPTGKVDRPKSVKAYMRVTKQPKIGPLLRRCGFERAALEHLKGPPGTDSISTSLRFKTARGAKYCRKVDKLPKGRKVAGLPHSVLYHLGSGDHPGRNLNFRVGGTLYLVAFSPTSSFDPGDSGLIAAAKTLYARVR